MKKILLIIVTATLLISCQKEEPITPIVTNPPTGGNTTFGSGNGKVNYFSLKFNDFSGTISSDSIINSFDMIRYFNTTTGFDTTYYPLTPSMWEVDSFSQVNVLVKIKLNIPEADTTDMAVVDFFLYNDQTTNYEYEYWVAFEPYDSVGSYDYIGWTENPNHGINQQHRYLGN